MKVKADIPSTTDLLGKYVTDLQEGIVVGEIALGGTSKYVENYTGYSGDVTLQQGNYIALHATADTGATITAQLIGGADAAKTLDADGIVIARLTTNATSIRFTATKGGKTQVRDYSLLALKLEEDE